MWATFTVLCATLGGLIGIIISIILSLFVLPIFGMASAVVRGHFSQKKILKRLRKKLENDDKEERDK